MKNLYVIILFFLSFNLISQVPEPVGKQMPQNLLQELVDAIAKHEPVIYEINLKTLQRRLVYNDYEDRIRRNRSGFKEDAITFKIGEFRKLRNILD